MADEQDAGLVVAAIQMTSGTEVSANLSAAAALIDKARAGGALLVVLPENFAFMGRSDAQRLAIAEQPGEGPIQSWLAQTARQASCWIAGGTIPIRAGQDRFHSSCLVFDPAGEQRARYDKVHLFDVRIPGREEQYRESEKTVAGHAPVVCESPLGGLGLAVCYDLRFPEQFRAMLGMGMQAIALPAAFTRPTGAAHWRLLVRVRAVENLCPIIAAAQGGRHASGRTTWGHSMIVDPWGEVLAECADAPDIALARLDMARAAAIRAAFPALEHRRL